MRGGSKLHGLMLGWLLFAAPLLVSAGTYRIAVDEGGRYWFEDSAGTRFISLGVCAIDSNGFRPPPGSIYYGGPDGEPFNGDFAAWQGSTLEILRQGAFNTLGAWSHPKLGDGSVYAMPNLYIITAEPDRLANILRPGLEDLMRRTVREALAEHSHPDRIVGFFLDNEMSWYGPSPWTIRANSTLLEAIVALPANDEARRGAIQFLRRRHQDDIAAFRSAWGVAVDSFDAITTAVLEGSVTDGARADREAFTEAMAERFFATAARVLREEAPGKLNLGVRFAGSAPASVLRVCGKYCDVISLNAYRGRPGVDQRQLAQFWLATRKPIMITEFSWRGRINRSGNPNLRGAGSVVRTQAERGANYRVHVEEYIAQPHVIGMHWFAWADQSPQGRFDGENSNYGIVDIFHRPYEELLEAMGLTNRQAADIHRRSTTPLPTELPAPPPVVVEVGQFPDRPPMVEFLGVEPARPHEAFSAPDASFRITSGAPRGLVLLGESGSDWGGGISIFGPRAAVTGKAPLFAVDLDGYSELVLELETPKALFIEVILDEAGVAAPGSLTQRTESGDDGESFAWPAVKLEPGNTTLRLPIRDVQLRSTWGNQDGARRVNLESLKGPALVVQGSQGSVRLAILSIRLEKGS